MKITFVTFHNWRTKRLGGFHKLAEACADSGHEVVFFSAMRPYYIRFKHEERLNKEVLESLSKGIIYETERGGRIVNCTWPTLRLPMPLYKYVPEKINHWFNTHSFGKFKTFSRRFLDKTDVFVFESCDGIEMFDKIRTEYPNAKYVYRPSDPLATSNNAVILREEWNILHNSELVIIVNQEGVDLYRKKYNEFDKKVSYVLLSNGVDVSKFKTSYPKPQLLQKQNTALYVGALAPQWNLLSYSAMKCPNINFIVICPSTPPKDFLDLKLNNLTYIPGVDSSEVPIWITNCDVVIVPNPTGRWRIKPWGITAKYYQAMVAGKPIVAYEDTPRLKSEHNIDVAYTFDEFVEYIKQEMKEKGIKKYNLENKDWNQIKSRFVELISDICYE